jgi:hypothetical protein
MDAEAPASKLFIPACGDRITLAAPWKFRLFFEHRNVKFLEQLKLIEKGKSSWRDGRTADGRLLHFDAKLPAGTVLECDRVYIRGYNKSRVAANEENDYDSITWKVIVKDKGKGRFWCKLSDACLIEYRLDWDAFYRDRVKAVRIVMES